MSTSKIGRIIGALFLSGFFLYGGGSFLVASTTNSGSAIPDDAASLGQLSAGATLLLLNSVAVFTIGILAFGVLRRRHERTAYVYLATRAVEALLLALAPLATLTLTLLSKSGAETSTPAGSGLQSWARTAVEDGPTAYWVAMATLGVGSVFFCWALMRSALLPRFLAVWGLVGYAIFALGSALQLAGFGVGLTLSVPGGVFEVAVGSYLLVKGFKAEMPKIVADADHIPTVDRRVLTTLHATN